MATTETASDLWGVVDTNATALKPNSSEYMPRVHDLRPGVRYELYADKTTRMPERDARIFLRDPSFIVTNAEGVVVRGLDEIQNMRQAPNERLPPDRVIAALEELTDDALRTRCFGMTAALSLPSNADRQTLIDFLMGAYEPPAPRGNDDRLQTGEANVDGDFDPASTAAKLLEGA